MKYLDYDRVKSRFLSSAVVAPDGFSEGSLFDNAEQYVLSHLNISAGELTQEQLKICEYAAAAVAVYDQAVMACLSRRPVMSENGEVTMQREKDDIIQAAARLRREAFAQLSSAGLSAPYEFAFIGV